MLKKSFFMFLCFLFIFVFVGNISAFDVKKSENTEEGIINFASDAPISTITIDKSKIEKNNLYYTNNGVLERVNLRDGETQPIDQAPRSGTNISFGVDNNGNVIGYNIPIKNGYSSLGNFTLIYKDAAIMSDSSRNNLEVIFSELSTIGSSSFPSGYTATIQFANVGNLAAGKSLSFVPKSLMVDDSNLFAVRTEIKFRIGKNGDVENNYDSFFFTASDINTRNTQEAYNYIVNEYGNNNYSESLEPMYGVNSESNLYLPYSTNLVENGNTTNGGYGHRFFYRGFDNLDSSNYNAGKYDYSLALVVRAGGFEGRVNNGFITRSWIAPSVTGDENKINFFDDELTHTITSSSGRNGKIELSTSGKWNNDGTSDDSTLLDGGSEGKSRIYSVPNGKTVTYKMTPNSEYILDKLETTTGGNYITYYKDGTTEENNTSEDKEVEFYLYTFEKSNSEDKFIKVKWDKVKYDITYNLNGGYNNSKNPDFYYKGTSFKLLNPRKKGFEFIGWEEGNTISSNDRGPKTFTAKWEEKSQLEDESIEKPNSDDSNKNDSEKDVDNPKTGDNISIYFCALLLSFVVLVFVIKLNNISVKNK